MASEERTVQNVIDGKPCDAVGRPAIDLVEPVRGTVFAQRAGLGRRRRRAGPTTRPSARPLGWGRSTPSQRQQAMLKLADLMPEHADDLVDAESPEHRQDPVADQERGARRATDQVRFFAGAARMFEGRAGGEYMAGFTSYVRREPIGVVGQVTPWNYPLMMAVWKIAPALAAGNTVVLKPSDTTPVSTALLAEIAQEALPPGVLNVVCGDRDTGRALIEHPAPGWSASPGPPAPASRWPAPPRPT